MDSHNLSISSIIADEEAQIAIEGFQAEIQWLEYQVSEFKMWKEELGVYMTFASDAEEAKGYQDQLDALQVDADAVLAALAEQEAGLAELMLAKEQAEEAQRLASLLASGDPDALEQVVEDATVALEKAETDLATALANQASVQELVDAD